MKQTGQINRHKGRQDTHTVAYYESQTVMQQNKHFAYIYQN